MAPSEVQLRCEELWDGHPKVSALFRFIECAAKLMRIPELQDRQCGLSVTKAVYGKFVQKLRRRLIIL